jgi:hypothetical protein
LQQVIIDFSYYQISIKSLLKKRLVSEVLLLELSLDEYFIIQEVGDIQRRGKEKTTKSLSIEKSFIPEDNSQEKIIYFLLLNCFL